MRHRAEPSFWRLYEELPDEVQEQANRAYELLKTNHRHPSLHFKRVGHLRTVRVGLHYRAVGAPAGDDLVWFWIGTHAEYDQLIG